jgi:two-component system response regulator YesN
LYKVLIVDDEREIRLGLRLKVERAKLNLIVAGEAGNGEEAVGAIASMDYDLILTDMKMPYRDGISLLEYCCQEYPHIRLIVITGYDDFRYTKAAIKNRVSDYLLKPVSQKELAASLVKVVKEMDNEKAEKSRRQAIDWKMSQYVEEMKTQFILNALKPFMKDFDAMEKRAILFQMADLVDQRVRFVSVGLTTGEKGREDAPEDYHLPLELLCRELAHQEEYPIAVFQDAEQPNQLFFIHPDSKVKMDSFIQRLKNVISEHLPYQPFVSIGPSAAGMSEWRESFITAVLAWKLREAELPKALAVSPMLSQDTVKQLQWHLIKGERQPFEKLLRKQLGHATIQPQMLDVKLIFQIALIIEAAAQSLGIHSFKQAEMWVTPAWLWEMNTPDKAYDFLMELSERVFDRDLRSNSTDQSVVESIQEMIRNNYMMDINLGMLAEQYNYNASYLSDLFKNKTGLTFIQYMTNVRMEKAVQLLKETELGLSEIAELTGFSNVSYFSVKFKKVFGVNPSTIRHPESSAPGEIQKN